MFQSLILFVWKNLAWTRCKYFGRKCLEDIRAQAPGAQGYRFFFSSQEPWLYWHRYVEQRRLNEGEWPWARKQSRQINLLHGNVGRNKTLAVSGGIGWGLMVSGLHIERRKNVDKAAWLTSFIDCIVSIFLLPVVTILRDWSWPHLCVCECVSTRTQTCPTVSFYIFYRCLHVGILWFGVGLFLCALSVRWSALNSTATELCINYPLSLCRCHFLCKNGCIPWVKHGNASRRAETSCDATSCEMCASPQCTSLLQLWRVYTIDSDPTHEGAHRISVWSEC